MRTRRDWRRRQQDSALANRDCSPKKTNSKFGRWFSPVAAATQATKPVPLAGVAPMLGPMSVADAGALGWGERKWGPWDARV